MGCAASVTVSPTLLSRTFLIDAMKYPTSPQSSSSTGVIAGANTPTSSTTNSLLLFIMRMRIPLAMRPSTIRTYTTTPRYASYFASKMSARNDPSRSPFGGGTRLTIASSTSVDADSLTSAGEDRVVGGDADDLLDLATHQLGVGIGEVDLVDDRDHLEVVVDRLVHVGERLRLDALGRVDDEQRALARREGT